MKKNYEKPMMEIVDLGIAEQLNAGELDVSFGGDAGEWTSQNVWGDN